MTSSTRSAGTLARRSASRRTSAPSCGAGKSARPPRYLPIGVRTAASKTGSLMASLSSLAHGIKRTEAAEVDAPVRNRGRRGEFIGQGVGLQQFVFRAGFDDAEGAVARGHIEFAVGQHRRSAVAVAMQIGLLIHLLACFGIETNQHAVRLGKIHQSVVD